MWEMAMFNELLEPPHTECMAVAGHEKKWQTCAWCKKYNVCVTVCNAIGVQRGSECHVQGVFRMS